MRGKSEKQAPYAFHGLDRVFHEKARLGIVSSLLGRTDGIPFSDLKSLCDLTDGNLNRHLRVLEEAGYVITIKDRAGSRPRTVCKLTEGGRRRFAEYLSVLEQVVRQAAAASEEGDPFDGGQPV